MAKIARSGCCCFCYSTGAVVVAVALIMAIWTTMAVGVAQNYERLQRKNRQ